MGVGVGYGVLCDFSWPMPLQRFQEAIRKAEERRTAILDQQEEPTSPTTTSHNGAGAGKVERSSAKRR